MQRLNHPKRIEYLEKKPLALVVINADQQMFSVAKLPAHITILPSEGWMGFCR